MNIFTHIEKYMGVIFSVALVGGLAFPSQTAFLDEYVVLFLSIALFFIFLKIDFRAMGSYLRPGLLAYLSIVFLLLIPALVFFGIRLIDPSLAVGFLLLFGVPTAATSTVVAHLLKGDAAFALVLQFLLYLLAPFTLPFLVLYLAGSIIVIDSIGLFLTMIQLLLAPLIAAQLVRQAVNTRPVERYITIISIVMLALIALGVMGKHADFVLVNAPEVAFVAALLVPLYAGVGALTYGLMIWRPPHERRTAVASKVFMNGSLALVLASRFFDPQTILIVLASIIVWYAALSAAQYMVK